MQTNREVAQRRAIPGEESHDAAQGANGMTGAGLEMQQPAFAIVAIARREPAYDEMAILGYN